MKNKFKKFKKEARIIFATANLSNRLEMFMAFCFFSFLIIVLTANVISS